MDRYNNTEDLVWIQETLEGRKESFGYLVLKYQDVIYNLVLRLTGDRDAADELA